MNVWKIWLNIIDNAQIRLCQQYPNEEKKQSILAKNGENSFFIGWCRDNASFLIYDIRIYIIFVSVNREKQFQRGKILSENGLQKCPRRRPTLGKQPGKTKGSTWWTKHKEDAGQTLVFRSKTGD